MKRKPLLAVSGAAALCGAALAIHFFKQPDAAVAPLSIASAVPADAGAPKTDYASIMALLDRTLASYRRIIVLFAGESALAPTEREAVEQVGHAIYYENQARLATLDETLSALVHSQEPGRFSVLSRVLSWIEAGDGLFDADRLAFREILRSLQEEVGSDSSLPAVKLHKQISDDLAALDEIEKLYDKELKRVFGRFEERAIAVQRQRWDEYVAKLKSLYNREQILKDYGRIIPYPEPEEKQVESREITGRGLAAKTLVLTFDDGPHRTYTEDIAAVLKQYGVPGLFFELGRNLGSVGADGSPKLGRLAEKSKKLRQAGFILGNHSFSHGNLSHQDGSALSDEVAKTDKLLRAINGDSSHLFRFPYGARGRTALTVLESFHLRSMIWNIDSRDWADPVPSSIADRVLRQIDKEQRGIVLFHDINERTAKVLPMILDRLIADGYRFAAWDGTGFVTGETTVTPSAKAAPSTGYRESWAVVVGIDDYAQWPKLQYAVRDADAIKQVLVGKLGFPDDHVFALKNQDATRSAILGILNEKLGEERVARDDRVLVFFAGHGTTRKLTSGRDVGYVVPVESDPQNAATDAISMTELQNAAESIPAKHVLFVMDSCYSGLGLTRGGSQNFLKENARRIGRQMLTAGGADQTVADGGPNGHSIFTWTVLQGLGGNADLNRDGFITATELAAYVAPAVAKVSQQTPAFGSLPGSEGGEFVVQLPTETEYLSEQSKQLGESAVALNQRIGEAASALEKAGSHSGPDAGLPQIMVKTLEGGEAQLLTGTPVPQAPRAMAEQANGRGLRLYREQRYPEAEAAFTEALKLKPDFAHAANNLGFVYYKQGKNEEAIRWFENTIRMDPSRAIAYYNLGDAYVKVGNNEKARKAYQTYLELAPQSSNAPKVREVLGKL